MPDIRDEDAIRQLDIEFMKAGDAKDAAALVTAFYAEDAVLMPPNHPIVGGHANIRAFLQGLMDGGFQRIKLVAKEIKAEGGIAYSRGAYTLTMTGPGNAAVDDVGKYIVVYHRRPDGAWRATADIFNSDGPAA